MRNRHADGQGVSSQQISRCRDVLRLPPLWHSQNRSRQNERFPAPTSNLGSVIPSGVDVPADKGSRGSLSHAAAPVFSTQHAPCSRHRSRRNERSSVTSCNPESGMTLGVDMPTGERRPRDPPRAAAAASSNFGRRRRRCATVQAL